MAKNLNAVKAYVRQFLRDELVSGQDYDWADDDLNMCIETVLQEISEESPREVRETLYIEGRTGTATATTANHLIDTTKSQFVAGDVGKVIYNTADESEATITVYNSTSDVTLSADIMASGESYEMYDAGGADIRDLDVSGISDLIRVEEIEYPVHKHPKEFRNFTRWGDVLRLDYDPIPEDDDAVYLYCGELHTLTETTSTLDGQLERLLIDGTIAYAASNWVNKLRPQVNAAITLLTDCNTAVDNVSARVTQAIDDLTSGRTLIGDMRAEAHTAIGKIAERIAQATDELVAGRVLINTVPQGEEPQTDHVNQAESQLRISTQYLNQAQAYLAEDADIDKHQSLAAGELNNAVTYLNQADGYISEMSSRLSIGRVINDYRRWANDKMSLYRFALAGITPIAISRQYAKS